ncbi:MAG TPA: CPBP family intramembrane glutamic endopeptidase [Thermoanaerobaculia bacterium]|nr:CPBP family intramembrane glutamic endopeptidase [Thermoanaerobaculia bacterium]
MAAALFPTLASWLYFVVWAHQPWMRWLYVGCKLVQATLPLLGWGWLHLRRDRPRVLHGGAWAGLGTGALLAAASLAALAGPLGRWAPLAVAPARILDRLAAVGAASPGRYLLLAIGLSVAHSLFEEYYWRWFLFGQLAQRLPLRWALPLASAAFALHHWIVIDNFLGGGHRLDATLPLTLLVAAAGALWAWLFQRYRSLLAPWLSHLLVDAALMAAGWRMVAGRW